MAANAGVCAGGCVFEFADEWWKSSGGSPAVHDTGGFPLGSVPDGFLNEEWWGLHAVSDNGTAPDLLLPRAGVEKLRALWVPTITIVTPPEPRTIAPGGTATFTVDATTPAGTPLSYQWLKDGAMIPGATGAMLTLDPLTPGDSADYAVRLTAGATTITSEAARLLVATPVPGRLVNLSVRSPAGTGEATLIAGFVIDGNVPRRLLIRGVGPTLLAYGVGSALDDPFLRVFDGASQPVASNDNWSEAPDAPTIAAIADAVHAFALASDSRDAALVRTFVPGLYTAHVTSVDGAIGVALVEVYEASEP
jgi:hypothetical protein